MLDPRMYRPVGYKNTIFHRIVPGYAQNARNMHEYSAGQMTNVVCCILSYARASRYMCADSWCKAAIS